MVTPESIYKNWCKLSQWKRRNVDPKWFTPEGKRAFIKEPAVIELSRFAQRIVTPALSQNFKISDALEQARRTANDRGKRYDAKKASQRPKSSVKIKPTRKPAARPSRREHLLLRRTSSGPILSNSPSHSSPSHSHYSRSTPTMSRALCPACGQIEDGCPCSR